MESPGKGSLPRLVEAIRDHGGLSGAYQGRLLLGVVGGPGYFGEALLEHWNSSPESKGFLLRAFTVDDSNPHDLTYQKP